MFKMDKNDISFGTSHFNTKAKYRLNTCIKFNDNNTICIDVNKYKVTKHTIQHTINVK